MRQPTCTPETLANAFADLLEDACALVTFAKKEYPKTAASYARSLRELEAMVYGPASRPDVTV